MELEQYINQEREIYNYILQYIEEEEEEEKCNEEEYQKLINLFKSHQVLEKRSETIEILQILVSISCNHHRNPNFYYKIERILDYFLDQLKQTFSNIELLHIFHREKRIIYYLITKSIFKNDKSFPQIFQTDLVNYYTASHTTYDFYFYPEIKNNIDNIQLDSNDLNKFQDIESLNLTEIEEKRKKGENDSIICSLIRNDSIIEFITYVNKTNYSLSSVIKPSIFETNLFLIEHQNPTLIEYASFYGSLQIYQYLRMNNVELSPMLWLYAIHGNNPEIIHLLEEDHIKPKNDIYYDLFKESVKCHHNSIAKYIKDNYLVINNASILEISFEFHNYEMIPNDLNDIDILNNACKYNFISIVKILLNDSKVDINRTKSVKFAYI